MKITKTMSNLSQQEIEDFDPMSESSFQKEKVSKAQFERIEENLKIVKSFYEKNKEILGKYTRSIDGLYSMSIIEKKEYNAVKAEQELLPKDWNPELYEA